MRYPNQKLYIFNPLCYALLTLSRFYQFQCHITIHIKLLKLSIISSDKDSFLKICNQSDIT